MHFPIVKDGWPWIVLPLVLGAVLCWGATLGGGARVALCLAGGASLLVCAYMIYFHRDPHREPVQDDSVALAGADGTIRRVERVEEPEHIKGEAIRISIYLSPMSVHTNRAPIRGRVEHLSYTPGRHLLTIRDEASEHNEHSTIFLRNEKTCCLLRQIVGPVVRRVVYWLEQGQVLAGGDVFGMMKFGSRLDTYLPAVDVDEVCVQKGDAVTAGITVVARLKNNKP